MKYLLCYLFLLLTFLVDRATKWIVCHLGAPSHEITSWLSFDLQLNRGISWSLFHSDNPWVFSLVSLGVAAVTACVVAHAFYQWHHDKPIYGQTFVIAGSLSNLLDRVMYGGVVDFIHLHIGQWSFAVFNVADAAIVIGVCLMMLQEVYGDNE